MNQAELDAYRLKLIRSISQIEDEEILRNIGNYLAMAIHPNKADYPYAPSKEELHSIIEQVLEDDRNGLFITMEELEEDMKTW